MRLEDGVGLVQRMDANETWVFIKRSIILQESFVNSSAAELI